MLNLIFVKNPEEKRQLFLKSDLTQKTWVVSDLTSKIAFQKELFKTQKLIPDESLLRAQELWIKLTKRLRGDLRFISSETAQMFTQQLLSNAEEEWQKRPGVSKLLHSYMQILMPLLSHEQNFEAMKEFFKNSVESFQKWGHWYLLSREIYNSFLDQKMILSTWASSILVNETDFQDVWNRKLIFDLGAQLQPIESELIQHLSKFLDVDVIVPHPSWKSEYSKALKSYDLLISGKPPVTEKIEHGLSRNFMKFTTQLAEVQNLSSELRKQISAGIKPTEIAIVAPDIGVYWPVLYEYLKIEGIPYQRKIQTPLKTYPEIMYWISKLKIEAGEIEYADLEINTYSEAETLPLKYDEFQSLYTNLYEISDLKRNRNIEKLFSLKNQSKFMTVKEFITWGLTLWKESWSQERVNILIEKLLAEIPMHLKFDSKQWVRLVDSFASRLEITTDEGFPEGVHCVDLVSLKDLDLKHAHLMGLTDQALRSMTTTLISEFDIQKLKQDFGFMVAEPERTELEFEVKWNLDSTKINFSMSYPQTDFDGNQMSPSIVWLTGAITQHGDKIPLKIPETSRLLQIQQSDYQTISTLQGWVDGDKKLERLRQDQGEDIQAWKLQNHLEKVSASQIEDYLKCPFINASKKILSLNDLPDLDLDIDYQTRGRLLHGVAELIYKNHSDLNVDNSTVAQYFDQVRLEIGTPIFDENVWAGQKKKYMKMIDNFLVFEREWKNKFPEIKEQYQEKDFEIHIDIATGNISKEATADSVLLRGRIDRIDIDQREQICVVIDYKFDSSGKSNHNRWIDENELQLVLYAMAIEKGALNKKLDVIGAVYYGFKKIDREKGFLILEADGFMFTVNSRKAHKISHDKKLELYGKAQEIIKNTLGGMKAGEYNPNPSDVSLCKTCNWRNLCRAPHLN
ncbi:MAG: PD-(D/E)XK nuclease family protein [Bdellovibrionota bacterium]